MNKNKLIKFIAIIILCEVIGAVGSIFTIPSISSWYASIQKPSFTPPNWVFGPVWTSLFFLMGVSLYLVLDKGLKNRNSKFAVSVFGVQFVLNVLWSFLFFGLHNPFLAFIEIIFLWFSILATIILFYRVSPKAGLLLIPYILWVSLASFLNYSVWMLN